MASMASEPGARNSELGRESCAAGVDGADHEIGHHEPVGERQGRQPAQDNRYEFDLERDGGGFRLEIRQVSKGKVFTFQLNVLEVADLHIMTTPTQEEWEAYWATDRSEEADFLD